MSLASGDPTVGPSSGICQSGGTGPDSPSYRMICPMVSRSSRLAIEIASNASGSSTSSADSRLATKPGVLTSRTTSNQASQSSRVASTTREMTSS